MQSANPAIIPRNHRVEVALSLAEEHDDFSSCHQLLAALLSPYETKTEFSEYRESPDDDGDYETFCGTGSAAICGIPEGNAPGCAVHI